MNSDELIKYRHSRALETFQEALILARENYWNATANRLYYACFYAVSALLLKVNVNSFIRSQRIHCRNFITSNLIFIKDFI